jgi:hypothetical protein
VIQGGSRIAGSDREIIPPPRDPQQTSVSRYKRQKEFGQDKRYGKFSELLNYEYFSSSTGID